MQSTQQNENRIKILKTQIDQLFLEVVSVWRDSDTKKTKAVKHLAARMEELYLSQGLDSMVNTISSSIAGKLEALGIRTGKHVHDYLDDKYKRDYEIKKPDYNLQNAVSGDISLTIFRLMK